MEGQMFDSLGKQEEVASWKRIDDHNDHHHIFDRRLCIREGKEKIIMTLAAKQHCVSRSANENGSVKRLLSLPS